MSKWFSGPPPSLGWWPASADNPPNKGYFRWWNGSVWSLPVQKNDPKWAVESAATFGLRDASEVQWQNRPKSWPARSRT